MHILDLIIYFILCIIIWLCLPADYTNDWGSFVGAIIILIFSIYYIIIFAVYPDFNWIDIFNGIKFNKIDFKL